MNDELKEEQTEIDEILRYGCDRACNQVNPITKLGPYPYSIYDCNVKTELKAFAEMNVALFESWSRDASSKEIEEEYYKKLENIHGVVSREMVNDAHKISSWVSMNNGAHINPKYTYVTDIRLILNGTKNDLNEFLDSSLKLIINGLTNNKSCIRTLAFLAKELYNKEIIYDQVIGKWTIPIVLPQLYAYKKLSIEKSHHGGVRIILDQKFSCSYEIFVGYDFYMSDNQKNALSMENCITSRTDFDATIDRSLTYQLDDKSILANLCAVVWMTPHVHEKFHDRLFYDKSFVYAHPQIDNIKISFGELTKTITNVEFIHFMGVTGFVVPLNPLLNTFDKIKEYILNIHEPAFHDKFVYSDCKSLHKMSVNFKDSNINKNFSAHIVFFEPNVMLYSNGLSGLRHTD